MLKRGLPLLVAGVFACIVIHLGSYPLRAQSRSVALALTLNADRITYKMSDTLHLEIRLTNIGSEDVYLWDQDMCWNPARGLSMRVMIPDGKEVQSPILLDCLPPPPRQGDSYQFLRIAPHAFYGQVYRFKVAELVNKPGEYTIHATFSSFLSASFIAETLSHDPTSANSGPWTCLPSRQITYR